MKRIAIMQPYVFPYIGYFQLIQAVDTFIFYDDVDFITRGWINRNRILVNGEEYLFTIPCKNISQNKLINEIAVAWDNREIRKLRKTIKHSYSNAPYFDEVYQILKDLFSEQPTNIAKLAGKSVQKCCEYLGISREFKYSSDQDYDNIDIENKADRLIDISKQEEAGHYINLPGGKELYEKSYFDDRGIKLSFLEPRIPEYDQEGDFTEGLSVIDIMMNVSPQEAQEMMKKGTLV